MLGSPALSLSRISGVLARVLWASLAVDSRLQCRERGQDGGLEGLLADVGVMVAGGARALTRSQIRRLLDEVGHPVIRLSRTAIGPVQLTGLRSGELRELTRDELGILLDAAKL